MTTMATTTSAASSVEDILISVSPEIENHLSSAIDETTGPLSAELLEFCELDLFPEIIQNSEVTSSSNFSYAANLSFPLDVDREYSSEPLESNTFQTHPNENNTFSAASAAAMIDNNNTMSIIFDSQDELDNTISSCIDFSTSTPYPYLTITHQDQLDFPPVQPDGQLTGIAVNSLSVSQYPSEPVISFMTPTLSSVYQEDCLSMMSPFLRLNPSASSSYNFADPSIDSLSGTQNSTLAADNSGLFTNTVLVSSELQSKEPEYFGDPRGKFCADQLQQVYNSSDIQNLSNDKQQLDNGAVSTPMSMEISSLEDSGFKAGKLSVEERKEKIHRYMKKRNERNFNKKIKYACRKTLADSRPRVRGRFAKNDDFGDTLMHMDYDEVHVKEEVDMVNSSDIFAHIGDARQFIYSNAPFPFSLGYEL